MIGVRTKTKTRDIGLVLKPWIMIGTNMRMRVGTNTGSNTGTNIRINEDC